MHNSFSIFRNHPELVLLKDHLSLKTKTEGGESLYVGGIHKLCG